MKVFVLNEESLNVGTFNLAVTSERLILSQELLDARNQFQFLLRRQVLILVEQELEFHLKALDKLLEGDLILLIGQLGQLLHSAVGLVTFKHDCVKQLRHDKEVIDLLP